MSADTLTDLTHTCRQRPPVHTHTHPPTTSVTESEEDLKRCHHLHHSIVMRSAMASPEQEPETTSSPAPLLLGLSVWAGLSGVALGLCKYTPTLGGMEA